MGVNIDLKPIDPKKPNNVQAFNIEGTTYRLVTCGRGGLRLRGETDSAGTDLVTEDIRAGVQYLTRRRVSAQTDGR